MSMSNFPDGFKYGVSIRGVPLTLTHPGAVFFVKSVNDSTGAANALAPNQKAGSDSNRGTFLDPLATIANAFTRVTAGRGDIIFLLPGHAETISTATATAFNIKGVALVGFGTGNLRPTLTYTTATATIPVSVDDIYIGNVLFKANFADVASVFTLTTAKNFVVDNCEFRDGSSVLNFLTIITTGSTANAADGLQLVNSAIYSLGTTAASTAMKVLGNCDRLKCNGNFYTGGVVNNTAALLAHAALVMTNLEMRANTVFRLNTDTSTGALLITTSATTNTGMVSDNYARHADVAAALLVTAGSIYGMTNNLANGDADASGFVLPAIGAN